MPGCAAPRALSAISARISGVGVGTGGSFSSGGASRPGRGGSLGRTGAASTGAAAGSAGRVERDQEPSWAAAIATTTSAPKTRAYRIYGYEYPKQGLAILTLCPT